jgi:hypothetical protein
MLQLFSQHTVYHKALQQRDRTYREIERERERIRVRTEHSPFGSSNSGRRGASEGKSAELGEGGAGEADGAKKKDKNVAEPQKEFCWPFGFSS